VSTNNHPFLHLTKIDIPPEIRTYVITLLNRTLACTLDLWSHVKQAAWNVKGKEFSQLHTLFGAIVPELETYADMMAERIVVLGGVAQGTARTVTTQSTLPEYPGDIGEGTAHLLALAERFAHYTTAIRESIAHAADVGEADTAAIYTDSSRGADRRLHILEAHLYQEEHG